MNIAAALIFGGNMIISDRHANRAKFFNNYIQAHFEEKFFIKPFTCPDCGNTHMLERGILCVQTTYDVNGRDYHENDKICDICAAPIRNDIEKKWKRFDEKGEMISYHDRNYFTDLGYSCFVREPR